MKEPIDIINDQVDDFEEKTSMSFQKPKSFQKQVEEKRDEILDSAWFNNALENMKSPQTLMMLLLILIMSLLVVNYNSEVGECREFYESYLNNNSRLQDRMVQNNYMKTKGLYIMSDIDLSNGGFQNETEPK